MPSEHRQFTAVAQIGVRAEDRPTIAECNDVADWFHQHTAKGSPRFRARLRAGDLAICTQLADATGMDVEQAQTLARALAYVERDALDWPLGAHILRGQNIVSPLQRSRLRALLAADRRGLVEPLVKCIRMQPVVCIASVVTAVRDWGDERRGHLAERFEFFAAKIEAANRRR
jgi:hypothetical protein